MQTTLRKSGWAVARTGTIGALLAAGALWAATSAENPDTGKKTPPLQSPTAEMPKKQLTLKEAQAQGLDTHTYRRMHNTLYSSKGEKLLAFDTGKGYQLFRILKGQRMPAADGTYDIKGGGQLKVEGGRIIWSDNVINNRYPNPGYVGMGPVGLA